MKNEELITALDEELENCIRKLRNARYGYEIRTFITEYEELMLKKSDLLKREFLKEEQEKKMSFTEQVWTEINKVEKKLVETERKTDMSFEFAEHAERQARQGKVLSILALVVSVITAIINSFIFCMR